MRGIPVLRASSCDTALIFGPVLLLPRPFRSHGRGVIGVFRTLLEEHPENIVQAKEALVSAIEDRSPRWIALMLWLGADPRARVKHPKWDDETVSGLEKAASHGLVDVLRKVKLDPKIDDFVGLVELVGISPDPATVEYLLSFNPDLTRSSESDESVMDRYISALCWSLDPSLSVGRPEKAMECIKLLARYGVRWNPSDRGKLSHLRSNLNRINPWHALDALVALLEANVFGDGVFATLMSRPKMRLLLTHHHTRITKLRLADWRQNNQKAMGMRVWM